MFPGILNFEQGRIGQEVERRTRNFCVEFSESDSCFLNADTLPDIKYLKLSAFTLVFKSYSR